MWMAKIITKEEIEILRENPYVKGAYPNRVSFTSNFKREYLRRYDAGEIGREILRSMGIDPEILGNSRIWTITGKIREELERHGEFSDVRRKSEHNIEESSLEQLRSEVAYLRQEVEFLKKNIILDMKAHRKVSRKVVRTQNLNSSEI